jgi:hypothetical protein
VLAVIVVVVVVVVVAVAVAVEVLAESGALLGAEEEGSWGAHLFVNRQGMQAMVTLVGFLDHRDRDWKPSLDSGPSWSANSFCAWMGESGIPCLLRSSWSKCSAHGWFWSAGRI